MKEPYDSTNSENPYLLNNFKDNIISIGGNKLTAEYIWSLKGQERKDLVEKIFKYYRNKEFPIIIDKRNLNKSYEKVVKKKPSEITKGNVIQNTISTGTDICKYYTYKKYFNAKGGKGTKSIIEVYNDDTILKKVIENRIGFNKTSEDGTDRPYVFAMSDNMILQGCVSSGLAFHVSNFKPIVAKYIYSKYAKDTVFDYSAGWGARCIGSISNNIEYYGVDPLTHNEVNNIITKFGAIGKVWGVGSDSDLSFIDKKFSCIFSSPPYYDLEVYSEEENQCNVKYKTYKEWLGGYWNNTVDNMIRMLDGYFILTMVDKVGKYEIAKDMLEICYNKGLYLVETYELKTANSHLSGKKKTKKITKNTDKIYVMKYK
jgi:hypothetical protein